MDRGEESEERPVIFRDIRRYYCEYCGICRSKKALIASHVLSHHKDEMEKAEANGDGEVEKEKTNTCGECGATFKKPAHLKQHMQSHSLERPFVCTIDDCHSSYRRKDHLNRHLLQHQGKLFKCPYENCKSEFAFHGNIKRHVEEFHSEDCPSKSDGGQKQYVCPEPGCGKVFKYPSKLRKHEDSHVKLDSVEAFCSEPGCMKYFSNKQCLKDHMQSCHTHIACEICGKNVWRKNIKSHLRTHEEGGSSVDKVKCEYKGCVLTFSKKSNLLKHVKAVHLEQKPFVCSFSGCGKRFSYKQVRDKHEKSGCHVYSYGDFEEADERPRAKGGRKRACPTVEMLLRKRISVPDQLGPEIEFLSQFLSQDDEAED